MALELWINTGNGDEEDYTPYLSDFQIDDQINQPTTCTLKLQSFGAFIPPPRSSYLRIWSRKYSMNIFTGFIVQDAELEYLGDSGIRRVFEFTIKATSDEWLLNVKSVPFIPVMINTSMGGILANLAATLCPNFFDLSNMDAGDTVPTFTYNPQQSWSEIAKQFSDGVRYRYKVIDKKIYFKPYGDEGLGIFYDEVLDPRKAFDPYSLKTTILTAQVINDAIIIGDTEPGNIRDDHFIGSAVIGNFPLKHSVYNGAETTLLSDDWTGNTFNTQFWTVFDPQDFISLQDDIGNAIGALNVVGGPNDGGLGTDYIVGVNVIEVGGDLNLQHGEVTFTDRNSGIIGGLYSGFGSDPSTLPFTSCLSGFFLSTNESTFVPNASGSAGIQIQPIVNGNVVGPVYETKIAKHYFLQTFINASRPIRYNRVFRTLNGTAFGGKDIDSHVTITYVVTEVDALNTTQISVALPLGPTPPIFAPPVTVMQFTTVAPLPSFCLYAPVNNNFLNIVLGGTLIARPPQGRLLITGQSDKSAGLPTLINPYPGQMPLQVKGTEVPFLLGAGFNNQVATIDQTGQAQILKFYSDTLPGVGVRIYLRTWEAQKAVARVFDQAAVDKEAKIPGDDGRRTAIVSNLNPLPRTAEECDLAAKALIFDRVNPLYNGTYSVPSYFYFQGEGSDYPRSGRYLFCNAPSRGLNNQNFLVTKVSMTLIELADEQLSLVISFGQDQTLPKLLQRFITPKQNVLTTQDAAVAPLAQELNLVGVSFLDDLVEARAIDWTGSTVTISVGVPLGNIGGLLPDISSGQVLRLILERTTPFHAYDTGASYPGCTQATPQNCVPIQFGTLDEAIYYSYQNGEIPYLVFTAQEAWDVISGAVPRDSHRILLPPTLLEVRRADLGWGNNDQNLILRTTDTTFSLSRTSFEQLYFLRLVSFRFTNGVRSAIISRRAKVIRIVCPLVPSAPTGYVITNPPLFTEPYHPIVALGLTGDIRNIYAIEIRAADDETVLLQRVYSSPTDLLFQYDNKTTKLRFLKFRAYFINLFNEYSLGTTIDKQLDGSLAEVPKPPPPVILETHPVTLVNAVAVVGSLVEVFIDDIPTKIGSIVQIVPDSTDTTNDLIIKDNHGFTTGTGIVVSEAGGGLSYGVEYFLHVYDEKTFSVHNTPAESALGNNKVPLTASITATIIPVFVITPRNDIISVTIQVDDVDTFDSPNVATYQQSYQSKIFQVDCVGKFIRVKRSDFLGDSDWSGVVGPVAAA